MDACVVCGRGPDVNAVLQVHHKVYRKGLLPWEYNLNECETLCKRCHAEKHGKIPPSTGWEFIGEEDLGGLYGSCDYCHSDIRYSFLVTHPDWEPMEVGIVCCDNLTGTAVASSLIESIHRFESRKKRFVDSPRWKNGRYQSVEIVQKKINVKIQPDKSGVHIYLNNIKGKKLFDSISSAKNFVFELIENGSADKYLKKRALKRKG